MRFCIVAVIATFVCTLVGRAEEAGKEGQSSQKTKIVVKVVDVDYLLYLPKGYHDAENKDKKWPTILFLHGAGERGTDVNQVKRHGPPRLVERRRKNDFPFILISPQCPPGERWDPKTLIGLLDEIQSKYNVDPDRVYLTGLSMGGFGTFATAIEYPNRFAAIAPICGGGNPQQAAALKNVPTWVFHGESDPTVPIAASEAMVNAIEAAGGDVQFTRYPGVKHDSWTQTYDNPKLYEWFLSHSLNQRKTKGGS